MPIPENMVLGRLCRRRHEYEDTRKTLRYAANRVCPACKREGWATRPRSPERDEAQRRVWADAGRRYRESERGREVRRAARERKAAQRASDVFDPVAAALLAGDLPSGTVPGRLCRRGHDYKGFGWSLRYRSNSACVECQRLWNGSAKAREARRVPESKARVRAAVDRYRERMSDDPGWRIKRRLRSRLREVVVAGGARPSRRYGIDWNAVVEALGPCPGDLRDYHIDHIRPLASFDLTDPEQVREAFAPENHQWLPAEENLRKSHKE